jgi:hypothetical protein
MAGSGQSDALMNAALKKETQAGFTDDRGCCFALA